MATRYPVPGDRVKMVGVMLNDPAPIPVGEEGTVETINVMAEQIQVKWDSGRTLMLLFEDPFTVL